jgi:hypothetical protein
MKLLHPILLVASLSGLSHAASVVQTLNYGFVPTNSAALTFNKFNPALGTLTSITITTNVIKSGGSLFVDNESATAASGNITQSVTITLTSPNVGLVNATFQPIGNGISATSTYAATVGADDGDGGGVQNTGPDYDGTNFTSVSNSDTGSVGVFAFGGYTGTGTFVINVSGAQSFDTGAIGGAAVAIDPAAVSGDVTLTYTYIPEPSAALLAGLGMLAVLRRRRIS